MAQPTPPSPFPASDLIRGIRWLGDSVECANSLGDVWSTTWADDDNLYTVADDTFPGATRGVTPLLGTREDPWSCAPDVETCNLALYRIDGSPTAPRVTVVNPMREYGDASAIDGVYTWKANSLVSVDGVLYMSVSQHAPAHTFPDRIQSAFDATIIKSVDHGKTWSSRPAVGRPMFPSKFFATPMFVQFGKDYSGAMDEFVYALSTSGVWNNGNYMVLGRVRRDRIGELNAADWEFFRRPNGWTKDLSAEHIKDANSDHGIFKHRGYTSLTGLQYVPAIKRFILAQWAYTNLDADSITEAFSQTMLCLYEALKPWGPWRHFHTEPDWLHANYNPCLPAKWFEDGGKRMWMVSSGDFVRGRVPDTHYRFTAQQLELCL